MAWIGTPDQLSLVAICTGERSNSGATNPASVFSAPNGVRLCRPSELVLDLLPAQQGEFVKEDGERVRLDRGV